MKVLAKRRLRRDTRTDNVLQALQFAEAELSLYTGIPCPNYANVGVHKPCGGNSATKESYAVEKCEQKEEIFPCHRNDYLLVETLKNWETTLEESISLELELELEECKEENNSDASQKQSTTTAPITNNEGQTARTETPLGQTKTKTLKKIASFEIDTESKPSSALPSPSRATRLRLLKHAQETQQRRRTTRYTSPSPTSLPSFPPSFKETITENRKQAIYHPYEEEEEEDIIPAPPQGGVSKTKIRMTQHTTGYPEEESVEQEFQTNEPYLGETATITNIDEKMDCAAENEDGRFRAMVQREVLEMLWKDDYPEPRSDKTSQTSRIKEEKLLQNPISDGKALLQDKKTGVWHVVQQEPTCPISTKGQETTSQLQETLPSHEINSARNMKIIQYHANLLPMISGWKTLGIEQE